MKLGEKFKLLLILEIPFLISCGSGAGHGHNKGSIVTIENAQQAQACEESKEIKVGDKLKIYETVCMNPGKKLVKIPGSKGSCSRVFRGLAEVIEITDQHYSKIKAVDTLVLRVGEITEKIEN